jgi:hypothetical protein
MKSVKGVRLKENKTDKRTEAAVPVVDEAARQQAFALLGLPNRPRVTKSPVAMTSSSAR